MSESATKVQLASGLIWRTVDNDAVIVAPQSGSVRVLNGIGSKIWQLISEGKDLTQIVNYLVDHYEVPWEKAQIDLHEFLTDLQARGLIFWEP